MTRLLTIILLLLAAPTMAQEIPTTATTSWGTQVEFQTTEEGTRARIAPTSPWQPCYLVPAVGGGHVLACIGVGSFTVGEQ